jgi:hypothetical protein
VTNREAEFAWLLTSLSLVNLYALRSVMLARLAARPAGSLSKGSLSNGSLSVVEDCRQWLFVMPAPVILGAAP